jgi:hypothetical protein
MISASSFESAGLSTAASAPIKARLRTYLVLAIIGIALLIRLYGISLYTLGIDEYGSIAEARRVGLNWNSILYSGLMHYWIRMGMSEAWLRLPATLFGLMTVPLVFKAAELLGGWRAGIAAAWLAATSPFNVYHSQEVRFYTFFMFASAAFMVTTIGYAGSRRVGRGRLSILFASLVLLISHFLGVLALYAQGAAALLANKRRTSLPWLILVFGLPLLLFGLPLMPPIQTRLWYLYQVYGNAMGHQPMVTPISLISFAKIAFAGYVFVFGYHVYPLRLVPVLAGLSLTAFLLGRGTLRLWKQRQWRVLPFTYLLVVFGAYLVLDAVGGRLASGVSPRHVAFAWPAFVVLVALGLSSFTRATFHVLLAVLLGINVLSLWFGWQKDWTYGSAADYRSAGAYVSRWAEKDAAIIPDARSQDPIEFYFPKGVPLVNAWAYPQGDLNKLLPYQRLIFVTEDWTLNTRRDSDRLMEKLSDGFSCIDGRVDYPLFEYVLEPKSLPQSSGYPLHPSTAQLRQPLSIYGLEFQDLRLPVSVEVKKVPLQVIGAYGLPDLEGRSTLTIPLSQPTHAGRLILLTDVVALDRLQAGEQIAEVIVENKGGTSDTFTLRLGEETALWDEQCRVRANCETVYQWHKRIAIVGQNNFPGAWHDFQAGLHGVSFDLPQATEVTSLTLRYVAGSGHLYVWGIALPA